MHSGYCNYCGKRTYTSRMKAKRFVKSTFPQDRLRTYKCPVSEYYHIGHLPRLQIAGLV